MTEDGFGPLLRGGQGGTRQAVAFGWQNSISQSMSVADVSQTLDKSKSVATHYDMTVRRLTPRECERLQGFKDDYTRIPGKDSDGPRYKALGNSMATNVMHWIGSRIDQVERVTAALKSAA